MSEVPGWDEILPELSPKDQFTVARMLAWNDFADRIADRLAGQDPA